MRVGKTIISHVFDFIVPMGAVEVSEKFKEKCYELHNVAFLNVLLSIKFF